MKDGLIHNVMCNVLVSVCEGESGWYIVLICFLVDNKTLETALVSH